MELGFLVRHEGCRDGVDLADQMLLQGGDVGGGDVQAHDIDLDGEDGDGADAEAEEVVFGFA